MTLMISWVSSLNMLYHSFFFQAEDGIRDPLVTGVQTCALPISVEGDEPQHDGRRSDERSTARHRTRLSGTHHRSRALRDVPCKVADEDRGDAGRVPRVLAAEGMDESGADPHNRDHRDARGQHGRWWCRPYRWNRLRGGTWHLRGRCEYRWRSHMEVGA